MKLGLGSYTYVWAVGVPDYPLPSRPLTAAGLLRKAAEAGVRVVQLADNLPLDRCSSEELRELRAQADALRLEIELGTAGTNAKTLACHVAIARALRARVLRTVIDCGDDRPDPDEVVGRLRASLELFTDAGVTLAIENHDRLPARTLAAIVERLDSPHVGICLDTANSLGCMEGIDHVLEVLGPWVVNLHIKDVRVFRPSHLKGFIVEGRPAGQGQIDIPRLLERLRAFNRDPNAILELWPPPADDVDQAVAREEEWARASLAYLRTLIPE